MDTSTRSREEEARSIEGRRRRRRKKRRRQRSQGDFGMKEGLQPPRRRLARARASEAEQRVGAGGE